MSATVHYCDFGAVGDGKTNDVPAIAAAHAYANANHCPVRATPGAVYYLGEADAPIVIQTDTDWTDAAFIIDDSQIPPEKGARPLFTVPSSFQPIPFEITGSVKAGQPKLNVPLRQKCLVEIKNADKRIYARYGPNQGNGCPVSDIFLADEDGNIRTDAPIQWDYDHVTYASATPIDTVALTIRGGTFQTIANQAPSFYTYYGRGIHVSRSNTVVEGLTHTVTGEGDHGAPYGGFLDFADCADIVISHCTLTGHKTYCTKGDDGSMVGMGTYDLLFTRCIRPTLLHCSQTNDIRDNAYWGIMGSNYCKDMVMEHCVFSRFDAHQGVVNVTIRNCSLGHQGAETIGAGLFLVENTCFYGGGSMISLRFDYGSTWHGDMILRNCTWIPGGTTPFSQLEVISGWYHEFFDFGYDCYMPTHVVLENLTVDDRNAAPTFPGVYLLGGITPEYQTDAYEEDIIRRGGKLYHVPQELTVSGFKSLSGRKWVLSPLPIMYRTMRVVDRDGQ